MGLESVEIVMDMEDHFHIQIPDSAASNCVTVADLQEVIINLLADQGRPRSKELEREVWIGMLTVLAKEGYDADRVKPTSKWIGDITRYG